MLASAVKEYSVDCFFTWNEVTKRLFSRVSPVLRPLPDLKPPRRPTGEVPSVAFQEVGMAPRHWRGYALKSLIRNWVLSTDINAQQNSFEFRLQYFIYSSAKFVPLRGSHFASNDLYISDSTDYDYGYWEPRLDDGLVACKYRKGQGATIPCTDSNSLSGIVGTARVRRLLRQMAKQDLAIRRKDIKR